MFKLDIIKDVLVFSIVYVPPFLVFSKFWREKKKSNLLLVLIGIAYVITCIFTENLIPFIFVLLNMRYLKHRDGPYEFDIRRFKFFNAIVSVVVFYLIAIGISIIETIILSNFRVELKQQEIVTHMANMSLNKFLIMIPVIIIFAPILEEFVFRWLLFEKIFTKRMGIYMAALLSSLIFAVIHFSLNAFPIIFWIGIYNCYLINKKGYWYAVFNHCAFNSVTVAALLLQKLSMM